MERNQRRRTHRILAVSACTALVLLVGAGCIGVRTQIGGRSGPDGMELECHADCIAWDVNDQVLDSASVGVAAAAGWHSLPAGDQPHEDQVARCTKFSSDMAEVCSGYLRTAVRVGDP